MQGYLDRIAAYDKNGPAINALISLNPPRSRKPTGSTPRSDRRIRRPAARHPAHHEGPGRCRRHADHAGLGAVQGLHAAKDAFVAAKLKKAGAIFLGKATLGELGGGDTHGSLFGSTRNVYDLSAPPAARPAARAPPYRPTSAPSRSDRRASPRSAAPRSGTASPACARRWAWSAAAASMAAGRPSTARSARWRGPSPISPRCSTAWSATTPTIR